MRRAISAGRPVLASFFAQLKQWLEWKDIRHQVEAAVLLLPRFLQSARNKVDGAERNHTLLQLMMEALQAWMRYGRFALLMIDELPASLNETHIQYPSPAPSDNEPLATSVFPNVPWGARAT